MTRYVPRLVNEHFGRFVIVERDDRRKVRYWTGLAWSPRLREARLFARIEDVNEVINARFEPPSLFDRGV